MPEEVVWDVLARSGVSRSKSSFPEVNVNDCELSVHDWPLISVGPTSDLEIQETPLAVDFSFLYKTN